MKRIITILLVFCSVLAFGQGGSPNLRAITEFLKFEGNATGEKGLSGSIVGATLTTGKVGQCYDYDGVSDYVSIPDNTIFDFEYNDSYSFSIWVFFDNITTQSRMIYSKQNNAAPFRGYNCYRSSSSGNVQLEMINDNSPSYALVNSYTFTPTLSTWYHFTITYDGSETNTGFNLYIDGEIKTPSATTNTLGGRTILNSEPLQVGARGGVSAEFDGKLDELMIFPRELKAIEAKQLFYGSTNGLLYVYENFKNGKITFPEYLEYLKHKA